VDSGLHERPARLGLDSNPELLSTALLVLKEEEHGQGHKRQDDGKSTIAPAPVGVVELLRERGATVRGDDVWRGGEGVCQATVLELRRVGSENVDRKDDTDEADGIEDLGCQLRCTEERSQNSLGRHNKCKCWCKQR
jgi:hypothetical protein